MEDINSMPDITEQFHGSDLEKIEAVYHIKKEEITSFSANVNPLGISPLLPGFDPGSPARRVKWK